MTEPELSICLTALINGALSRLWWGWCYSCCLWNCSPIPFFPKLKYFFLGLAHIPMENGIFHEMYLACEQQQKGEGMQVRNNQMRERKGN